MMCGIVPDNCNVSNRERQVYEEKHKNTICLRYMTFCCVLKLWKYVKTDDGHKVRGKITSPFFE